MKIHEYQAKELFRKFGIPTSRGVVVTDPAQAPKAAAEVGYPCVVKAQVHVGGRGKAGGVKLARNEAELIEHARAILGMDIKGLVVERVLIDEAVDIADELYLGIILDRASKFPVFMVSAAGGVDIEEVAAKTPEKILKLPVDPAVGFWPHHGRRLSGFLGGDLGVRRQLADFLEKLYRLFLATDASLAEINPCVITSDGRAVAIDAKIVFDDNALFRQAEVEAMRDKSAEDPLELKAKDAGLSYVKLSGDVGCIVNGAGLAMTTMDLIKHFGSEPANFLDVGGSSDPAKVLVAMEIVTGDPDVKAILLNIFGGITRCDDIAAGLLAALKKRPLAIPLVVRLTGTNEDRGRAMLAEAGIEAGVNLDEAVQKAVHAARGGR
ncbi:MAG: ADP-forming succinate--CoA ligase subunit beta [bacterium]|nr:ADP-forming succinate--CoA ligase subunit beta [bacterium]